MHKLPACLLFAAISTPFLLRTPAKAQNQPPPESSTLAGVASSDATPEAPKPFFAGLVDAYKEDWHPTQPAGPDPVRRGYPAPLDSPPFPSGDYSVGGTPVIGA